METFAISERLDTTTVVDTTIPEYLWRPDEAPDADSETTDSSQPNDKLELNVAEESDDVRRAFLVVVGRIYVIGYTRDDIMGMNTEELLQLEAFHTRGEVKGLAKDVTERVLRAYLNHIGVRRNAIRHLLDAAEKQSRNISNIARVVTGHLWAAFDWRKTGDDKQ